MSRPTFANGLAALDIAAELDELEQVAAESIGWQPLGEQAYLHVGKLASDDLVITVVGTPDSSMAGMAVLLLG